MVLSKGTAAVREQSCKAADEAGLLCAILKMEPKARNVYQ